MFNYLRKVVTNQPKPVKMKKIKSLSTFLFLICTISLITYSCKDMDAKSDAGDTSQTEEAEVAPYEVSPNEEANMKLVTEFIDALLSNDMVKAKSMVSDDFMDRGPSAKDSANIDQVTARWAATDSLRSNQDSGIFAANSLQVNDGPYTGDWVSVWGNYTADLNGSDYKYDVPWHRVFQIADGKIVFTHVWYDSLAIALDLGTVAPVPAE